MSTSEGRIVARQPWAGSGVLQAHVARTLPGPLRQPGLGDLEAATARPAMEPEFLAGLEASLDHEPAQRLRRCADPRALAVVTGQQPGCAGGSLLVLAKAATAVALARRAEQRLRRPVVPVFWNATDDVDHEEIARVSWPGPRGELLFLELSRRGRRSQSLVGDLDAAADEAVARAAVQLLGPAAQRRLEPLLPDVARDHGDWVARLVGRVFPTLAVVDARWPALRRFAAPLFARYLDSIEAATAELEASRAALAAAGFKATLSAESLTQGLFLLRDGQRHKTKETSLLQRTLRETPEIISPSVILRPLVQDSLFPIVACVVGPAEVAYLHELGGLRAHLDVPAVALVPRLGLSLLEPDELQAAARLGLDLEALLMDAEAVLRDVVRRRLAPRFESARTAFETLQLELEGLAADRLTGKSVERVVRRLRKLHEELGRGLEEAGLRGLWEAEPALEGLPARLRPRGRAQERSLAALWLLSRWGSESGERLVELAGIHLDGLERGTLEHLLVVT